MVKTVFEKWLDNVNLIKLLDNNVSETHLKKLDVGNAKKSFFSNSYQDKCCQEWEMLRSVIIKNDKIQLWEDWFQKAKDLTLNKINQSTKAQKLIMRLGIDVDFFVGSLPFIGSVGELIAYHNFETGFYSSQLIIYKAGFWVCGFENNQYLVCSEV